MRFVLGSDEARPVVDHIAARLREKGHDVRTIAIGAWGAVAIDVAKAVASGDVDQGIVCCWTGTGVSIAANKVPGVRAALCYDYASAVNSREHNDANVLTLGARVLSERHIIEVVASFLAAQFAGGRHQRRLDKISELDQEPKHTA